MEAEPRSVDYERLKAGDSPNKIKFRVCLSSKNKKVNIILFENSLTQILQFCDHFRVEKRTKFLCSVYLGYGFYGFEIRKPLMAEGVCLISLSLASKLNENRALSNTFTPNYLNQVSRNSLHERFFVRAQAELLQLMDFATNFTTPYDFLEVFDSIESAEVSTLMRRGPVELLIDFAITIPESFFHTAEQIFYTCFMASLALSRHPSEVEEIRNRMAHEFDSDDLLQKVIAHYSEALNDEMSSTSQASTDLPKL